jgi:hypothetical protein
LSGDCSTGTWTIDQKATPTITWANPAAITYGTALSGTQLNATTSVLGSFVYTPASGTVLDAGNGQTLHVDFTPTDAANYNSASKDVTINVLKRAVTVTADAKSKTYGDPDPALTYQVTSGSLVGSDAFSGALARAAGENVGTYAIYQGTLAWAPTTTCPSLAADLTIRSAPGIDGHSRRQEQDLWRCRPGIDLSALASGSLAFSGCL